MEGELSTLATTRERYEVVNVAWTEKPIPLDDGEAIKIARLILKQELGRSFKRKYVITSGNRHSWSYGKEFRVNTSYGWRRLVHDLSHYIHRKRFPTAPGHDPAHAGLEKRLAAQVESSRWLDGRFKATPKPKRLAPPLTERRAAKAQRALERAERALANAERRTKKWTAKVRYYERKAA